MKYHWCKYRQEVSSGVADWSYIFVPESLDTNARVEDWLDRHNLLDKWSEHYRGVEIKRVNVKKVPENVILDEIKYAQEERNEWNEKIEWLTNCYDIIYQNNYK